MTACHLAQFNVARLLRPLDDPATAGFLAGMTAMNDLADRSPGFVWRIAEDGADDATGIRPVAPDVIITMSVWESLEALRAYTYQTEHLDFLRRRREWFLPNDLPAALVLWWVPAGSIPTVDEAMERLDLLGSAGPTPDAFTFRRPYPVPAGAVAPA